MATESKLVRVLRYAGKPLTLNEAYKLQSEVFPVNRDEDGFITDELTEEEIVHNLPTYSYGMFTGNAAAQLKNKQPKIERQHNGKVWVYSLIEWRNN